jgi:hypothetical protein
MLKIYNELLRINHSIRTFFMCGFQLINKKVYTILISNTISGSFNLDNSFIFD